ncbi:MAG TPA: protein translocase subunit SecD [Anaerolineales bacterium]|jgi:preprotein translocase subunit SecD|nr:protein translocase subunit SecD [Anaerolineales bacterium]
MRTYRWLVIILVVVAAAIWIDLPNNPGIHIAGINREIETRLGLDLVGGVQALLEADLPEGTAVDSEKMQTATRIVENRVNGLGVTEALVQQAGDQRIVVELPGIEDPTIAISTIQETGLLEFVSMGLSPQPAGAIIVTDVATSEAPLEGQQVWETIMTGDTIENVQVSRDPSGQYVIQFRLNSEGAQIFADYTTQHVGEYLGIVLDKTVISAPVVNEPIKEGEGVISGAFTLESANNLAIQLRYGSLPIPLKVVETRTIGPSLGQDSLDKSLTALLIGFIVVILFMAIYYRLPGVLADISIIIYALVTFSIFRYLPVTLTLPGIAGFMLSTGSALDANILIFERLKEELRAGRKLNQAVDIAWKRAWPSIRDSNIATLITCGILFWFGSAFGATIVKGFSLTLAIGVMISLFTALIVTRTFMNLVLAFVRDKNYSRWFGI